MISRRKGILIEKQNAHVVIDVGGVGYEVLVSENTFQKLPIEGKDIVILTHTHVREDSFTLFGFASREEKELFLLLVSVSGIGPKLAMNFLAQEPNEIKNAIASENTAFLKSMPGVGQKTAERVILELKTKIKKCDWGNMPRVAANSKAFGLRDDVSSALLSLGYKQQAIDTVLGQLHDDISGQLPIETVIKKSLQLLGS